MRGSSDDWVTSTAAVRSPLRLTPTAATASTGDGNPTCTIRRMGAPPHSRVTQDSARGQCPRVPASRRQRPAASTAPAVTVASGPRNSPHGVAPRASTRHRLDVARSPTIASPPVICTTALASAGEATTRSALAPARCRSSGSTALPLDGSRITGPRAVPATSRPSARTSTCSTTADGRPRPTSNRVRSVPSRDIPRSPPPRVATQTVSPCTARSSTAAETGTARRSTTVPPAAEAGSPGASAANIDSSAASATAGRPAAVTGARRPSAASRRGPISSPTVPSP